MEWEHWSALGSRVSGDYNDIWGLATSGNDVYVARFTTAGSVSASRIAKWNGEQLVGTGFGMNEAVFALVVSGGTLYAGGAFTSAGGKLSAYVVKANISGLPFPGRFSNPLYSPTNGFSCMFVDASVGQPYRIQTLSSLAAGPWTDFTNFTYTAPITIIDASALSGTNKFFRAITPDSFGRRQSWTRMTRKVAPFVPQVAPIAMKKARLTFSGLHLCPGQAAFRSGSRTFAPIVVRIGVIGTSVFQN